MNYQKTATQFINCTLPKAEWTHHAHLITCIWHLENYSLIESICLLRARIIQYNIASGGSNTTNAGYHETLTQFYVKVVNQFLQENENINDSFSDKCDKLLKSDLADKEYPFKFYSKELLFSLPWRATWIEPDLQKI
jgi:hypothetical protein